MDDRKDLLLASSARLYSLGVDLEGARERLRCLVEQGVPYDSDEMLRAYQEFTEIDRQWKAMEKHHIELRDEIMRDRKEKR
ncbi:MAG: hypothetical protein IJ049_01250 [Oscillospiraceae bacterium]|nr:hypothetical protein [Oscillospiraceae bacterium]